MYRRFKRDELGPLKQLKASQSKHVKTLISEQYPLLPLDKILPKDLPVFSSNNKIDRSVALLCNNKICFLQYKDVFVPTLWIVMAYPTIMKSVQVDDGAIKHVLDGSNIMCPGLTSAGGKLPDELEENEYVVVMAENKVHPVAIGLMKMSSETIKKENKGIAIEVNQYAGDGIWMDCVN
ncbi:PUA domain-containing protein [Entamoeba marina]